jgi:hypothetical protein
MSLPKEDSEFQKAVGYIHDYFLATFEVKHNITVQYKQQYDVYIDNYKWDLNEKTNITIANGFKTPSWRKGVFRFHVDQDTTTNVAFYYAAPGNRPTQITTLGIEQEYRALSDITFKVGCIYNCRDITVVNCSEKSPCRIFVQGFKRFF